MGSPRLESRLCPLPVEEPSNGSEHWCGSSAAHLGQGYAGDLVERRIKNAWKAVGAWWTLVGLTISGLKLLA